MKNNKDKGVKVKIVKGKVEVLLPLTESRNTFKKYIFEKKFTEAYDIFKSHNEVLLVYYNQVEKEGINVFYAEAQKEIGNEKILNMKAVLPDLINQYKKEIEEFGEKIKAIDKQYRLDKQISRKTLDTVFDI